MNLFLENILIILYLFYNRYINQIYFRKLGFAKMMNVKLNMIYHFRCCGVVVLYRIRIDYGTIIKFILNILKISNILPSLEEKPVH